MTCNGAHFWVAAGYCFVFSYVFDYNYVPNRMLQQEKVDRFWGFKLMSVEYDHMPYKRRECEWFLSFGLHGATCTGSLDSAELVMEESK